MTLLKRKRTLAAKVEDTAGSAEATTATEAAFNVHDVMIQQAAEMQERMKQNGFDRLPSVVSARQGRCTFATHLYGNGASPAGMAVFLPACGLGLDTGEYIADDVPPGGAGSTQKTATLACYQNGRKKQIFGAMGNMTLELPASRLAVASFDFLGKWTAPTDSAMLAPSYPTLTPLRVVSATLTIGAYGDFKVATVNIDLGNQLYLREDVDDATGYSHTIITDRLVTVSIDPEAELVATKDVYGEWLAGTEADLSVVCTNGTDTCTITASDLQFINPQEADRNGIETDSIDCQINTDDLTIVFA